MGRHKVQHLKRRKDGRYKAVYHGIEFMAWSEAEALRLRQEYIDNENSGLRRTTVTEFALEWLPLYRPRGSVRDQTYRELSIHLEHLANQVGSLYLDEVTPLDMQRVYAEEYAGLSASYIRAAQQLFNAFF